MDGELATTFVNGTLALQREPAAVPETGATSVSVAAARPASAVRNRFIRAPPLPRPAAFGRFDSDRATGE
jgi:hypothetical protein